MFKIILLAITLSVQLFSDVSVLSVKTFKDEIVEINRDHVSNIKSNFSKKWNEIIDGQGTVELEIIINTKKGSVEHIVIYSKYGSLKFKKSFKEFYTKLYKIRFKPFLAKKILKVRFEASSNIKESEVLSTLKGSVQDPYEMYLNFLRKHYKYTNKKISTVLHSDKRTASKVMMEAIYLDYTKNDIESARKNYNLLFEHKSSRFIGKPEAIFLVDFLSRENRDKDVLFILPKNSCEFMEDKFKYRCHYYRAKSLYALNDRNYIIPLGLSKHYIHQARQLDYKIKNRGRD